MDTKLHERMDDMVESNEDKKYELTDETMEFDGPDPHILHRIRALKDFSTANYVIGDVKAGQLGGWVESEDNLSQKGKCWVSGNAKVYGGAKVYEDASVMGQALVFDNAKVYGGAAIYEDAEIFGDAKVHGTAHVYGGCERYNDYDELQYFKTLVYGNADICTGVIGRGETVTEVKPPYGISIKTIDTNDDYDNLFAESISQLGLSKAQMEAVMRIHDIAYGEKSLNEGKLSNAIGAGFIGAASLLSPANAQNINDNWVDYVGDDSDSLTTEQMQEHNKEMADRYLNSVINTKSWNEVSAATVHDNPVNSGEYENTLRPIKDLDDAIDHMNEELDRHIDMNIDIDEQLKVNDKENFSDALDRWSDELLENLKKLAVESGDDEEHPNTFGIGYSKNGDMEDAEELAIKDAIKTFKDRASVPEGYKLVLYPDIAKFVLSLPDGNGRWYERSVVGVVVHLVSDDKYENVPEHLRIGDLKPTF